MTLQLKLTSEVCGQWVDDVLVGYGRWLVVMVMVMVVVMVIV